MDSVILDYDDFDLETETADRLTLREAVQKTSEIRNVEPDTFVRIKKVGTDEFIIVKVSASEVFAEWKERMRHRLARISRRSASK
jgi:hypothetical protein